MNRFDVKNIMAITSYTYNGNEIPFDINGDVILNATQMAKPYGKLVKDWLILKQTQEYIKALIISREGNSPNGDYQALTDFANIPGYTRTVQGGKPDEQGTWVHRKIAIRFAQWLNPNFAIWVDNKIEDLLLNGFTSTTREYVTRMIENGQLRLTIPEIKGLNGGRYKLMPSEYWQNENFEWSYTNFHINNRVDNIETATDPDGQKWYNMPRLLKFMGFNDSEATGFIKNCSYGHIKQLCPFNKAYKRFFASEQVIGHIGFGNDNNLRIAGDIRLRATHIPDFEKRFMRLIDSAKTMDEKEFLIDLYKLFK